MQIYAYGHSLVDDFPYHKSVLRAYGAATVSHPTVVIDYKNRKAGIAPGMWIVRSLMDGVAAIRVDDTRAYYGLATKYVRSLILNSIDPDMPYVVDLFEVAGGSTHDYMMRSSVSIIPVVPRLWPRNGLPVSVPSCPMRRRGWNRDFGGNPSDPVVDCSLMWAWPHLRPVPFHLGV